MRRLRNTFALAVAATLAVAGAIAPAPAVSADEDTVWSAPATQAGQIIVTGWNRTTGEAVPITVHVQEPSKVYDLQGPAPVGVTARWTYCDYATEYAGLLNLYKYQGYCGVNWSFSVPSDTCVPFTGQPWTNNTGSGSNQAVRSVILSDATGCGGYPSAALGYISSHPNFVNIGGVNLYHKVSSFWGEP